MNTITVTPAFSVSSSQTDDRGEFRLFGLAPGHYYVSAADPAFRAVSTPKGVLYYSPTYFPGVPFADQARSWHDAGARLLGGCCRTTPQDIKAIYATYGVQHSTP